MFTTENHFTRKPRFHMLIRKVFPKKKYVKGNHRFIKMLVKHAWGFIFSKQRHHAKEQFFAKRESIKQS